MLGVIWSICSNVGDDNSLAGSESYKHNPWENVGTQEIQTSNMGEHTLTYQRCPGSTRWVPPMTAESWGTQIRKMIYRPTLGPCKHIIVGVLTQAVNITCSGLSFPFCTWAWVHMYVWSRRSNIRQITNFRSMSLSPIPVIVHHWQRRFSYTLPLILLVTHLHVPQKILGTIQFPLLKHVLLPGVIAWVLNVPQMLTC